MTQYLVAVRRPHGFDHAALLDEAARGDIDALNDEMESAGVRVFVGGLRATHCAKTVRLQEHGEIRISDGPYLAATDYVDGFWVLQCADEAEALSWGRKAAVACRASIEVRPFH